MAIARYYDASKNPEERAFDGVPLRDLTEEEFAELPPWLQASVDAAPFYRKTKPRHPTEPEPSGEGDQVDQAEAGESAAADGAPAETTTTTSPEGAPTRRRRE